jgi:Family of unknown function (DUF6311)
VASSSVATVPTVIKAILNRTGTQLQLAANVWRRINRNHPTWLIFGLATLIGLVFGLSIYGWSFFVGRGNYWEHPVGDIVTHRIGAIYFGRDVWRFPLFLVPDFGAPEGANIVFSDSIPLFALFAKIIYKVTGWLPDFFGFFIVICYPILAYFFAKTACEVGIKDPVLIVGAVCLALLNPALTYRYHHAALMAHFLIVWAILLYIRLRRKPTNRMLVVEFTAALVLAMMIQSYFVVMMFPFLLAAHFQALLERRVSFTFVMSAVAGVVAASIITAWCFGAIGHGIATPTLPGFGFYSMNILSPILPFRERFPDSIASMMSWDQRRFSWDATGGQIEGYNYLGLGLILLGALQLATIKRERETVQRHTFLILLMVILFFYSLSTKIYFGNWLIVNIPLNDFAAKTIGLFRTSGRMFWPFYYVLTLTALLFTMRRFQLRTAQGIVGLAIFVQFVDTMPVMRYAAVGTSTKYPQALKRVTWVPLLAQHKFMVQYPSYQCGGWGTQGKSPPNSNLELLLLAAENRVATNSVYLARPTMRNCNQERDEALQFNLRDGGLYVFNDTSMIQRLELKPDFKQLCREFSIGTMGGIVCSKLWTEILAAELGANFSNVSGYGRRDYTLGTQLNFKERGNGARFLKDGWSLIGDWGIWSFSDRSTVELEFPRPVQTPLKLQLNAITNVGPSTPMTTYKVVANGSEIGHITYSTNAPWAPITIDVPADVVSKTPGVLHISFEWHGPGLPTSKRTASVGHLYGFGLINLTVIEVSKD